MNDFMSEATKKIQIVTTEDDHQFLKMLADQAGVTQGFTLHILLEMVQLLVGSSVESGIIDDKTKMANLEAFVALIMRQMGLLTDDEFDRDVMLADAMEGERADLRMRGLAALANERIEQLRPIWEASRAEAAKRKAAEWDPQVAALRAHIAANVGAEMVAADKETT